MDRRKELVKLATELLSEQIQPVRIVSLSDAGGEPQGEFVSNQMRFTYKITRSGMVTYKPKGQGGAGREDAADSRDLLARLRQLKATLAAA